MHLLKIDSETLDAGEAAIDLGQSPAEIVFLSFSDSDLALMSLAAEDQHAGAPSLRLASLAQLKHPFSIDLYREKVISKARFVLVRLLGGLDYWRYGVEELVAASRAHGFPLAIIPGDDRADPRLAEASTVAAADLDRILAYCQYGGLANQRALLAFIAARFLGRDVEYAKPEPIPVAGLFEPACHAPEASHGHILLIFYRSFLLCGDIETITAMARALASRKLAVTTIFVPSLKDQAARAFIHDLLAAIQFDVILNTTGFSARLDAGASILDAADAPVLQAFLGTAGEAAWRADPRGLKAADLAMNICLPEMDGRLITTLIGALAEQPFRTDLEFTPRLHAPIFSRIAHVAERAAAIVHLRRTPPEERRLACIIPDYPGKGGDKGGQTGHAVGLDTGRSLAAIATLLAGAGYRIGDVPEAAGLLRALAESDKVETGGLAIPLGIYEKHFAALPEAFREAVQVQWGAPQDDPALQNGVFRFKALRCGALLMAVQPERTTWQDQRQDRKSAYHDAGLAPCHKYIAFHLFLRHDEKIHALIACGTHGTLEWLPGKAAALTEECAPEVLTGPLPVIYPFIVNNPGEAAQAKRRLAACTIGHMTPPLTAAGSHGIALELEALLDEYSGAEWLDPKRAERIGETILRRVRESNFAAFAGLSSLSPNFPQQDIRSALQQLDACLCDMKELRIGDGLHVFAQGTEQRPDIDAALAAQCNIAEATGLLAALDGRFVQPGPGGAPSRGRRDVLPTGRNLYGIDPRAVPTPTAWEIGWNAAEALLERHAQDHGDWPRAIVMDLWASATMRTGGDDFAQALALIGVKPRWDAATGRVSGFDILPNAKLGRPRVDVTLRISGLFRDVFPMQIALFDQAIGALSRLEEDDNPFAGAASGSPLARIFGAAPGAYGLGLSRALAEDPHLLRKDLGALYLAATSHAYGCAGGQEKANEGEASKGFADRVAEADAFLHMQDQAEQDALDSDAVIDHIGGFAAAAAALGNAPALYQIDTTKPETPRVRPLAGDIARLVQGRLTNPRWLHGQMRHGYRGAAEIARSADHLFAMAVLSDAVPPEAFERLFAALCLDDEIHAFLKRENPDAARALADCFEAARARNLWQSRRNSDSALLETLRASAEGSA
ncbi:cobaltochelatase subunit CobN [Beijerinckia mobilis]|uniref:cobaltochelatase subunit CobN n=1 Tax=Beijerinckia mobilis TaxID=231434 RepID=UPI0005552267|nr:cobaltochelatase subunit CobN [Beijerinckia mobilis]